MRIPAHWARVPVAIAVAAVVYLTMVWIGNYRPAETVAGRVPPKRFVPPPAPEKLRPVVPEAPIPLLTTPAPGAPVLPGVDLPPFRPGKANK
jgi:hypothetical protein